jgi:hypothetical protein
MNMYARISTVLDNYLSKLTTLDDPEAIALYLRSRGVQAVCGHISQCALAQDIGSVLVENDLPHWLNVDVSHNVHVVSRTKPRLLPPVNLPLPSVARAFTAQFDNGQYPELVSPYDLEGQRRVRCYREQLRQRRHYSQP